MWVSQNWLQVPVGIIQDWPHDPVCIVCKTRVEVAGGSFEQMPEAGWPDMGSKKAVKAGSHLDTVPVIGSLRARTCQPYPDVWQIRLGQFVDFALLPPASGSARPTSPHLEGDLVVIRAEDLARSRKLIPDIGVWMQYYLLWMSVVLTEEPGRAQEFLAYEFLIAKGSKSFQWPSWVLYDHKFHQERTN